MSAHFQRLVDICMANTFEQYCPVGAPPQIGMMTLLCLAPPGSEAWGSEDRILFASSIFNWLKQATHLRHEHHQRLYFVAEHARKYDFVTQLDAERGMTYCLAPIRVLAAAEAMMDIHKKE